MTATRHRNGTVIRGTSAEGSDRVVRWQGRQDVSVASALIVVGVVTLRARDVVSHRLSSNLGRLLPVLSAAMVGVVGMVLTIRGVVQL
jgi:hypothetical protein